MKQLTLADFEFNCFPPRIGINTMSCKVRAERLYPSLGKEPFGFDRFRFESLESYLMRHNILSDPSNQCLVYDTADGLIGIMDDDDVQSAVRYALRLGSHSIKLNVHTQDSLGQLFYPFVCPKLISE